MKSRFLLFSMMLMTTMFFACSKASKTDPAFVPGQNTGPDGEGEGEESGGDSSSGSQEPPAANVVASWDFEEWDDDGAVGWDVQNEENGSFAMGAGSKNVQSGQASLMVTNEDDATDNWKLQILSPEFSVVEDHEYEITYWVKAEGSGAVNQVEARAGGDPHYSGDRDSPQEWTQLSYTFTADATISDAHIAFDMGANPKGTITYIDNIIITDLSEEGGEPQGPEAVASFDFEDWDDGAPVGWDVANDSYGTFEMGAGKKNVHGGQASLKVSIDSEGESKDNWRLQIIGPQFSVIKDHEYEVTYWIRAEGVGSLNQVEVRVEGNTYYSGDRETPQEWTQLSYTFTAEATTDKAQIAFDMGSSPVGSISYIDDVEIVDLTGDSGSSGEPEPDPDEDIVVTWDFEGNWEIGENGWIPENEQYGSFSKGSGESDAQEGSGFLIVTLDNDAENIDGWRMQILSPQFSVKGGHQYQVSYWVRGLGSDGTSQVEARAGGDAQYGPEEDTPSSWTELTFDFEGKADTDEAQIGFDMGKNTLGSTVYIDHVVIRDLTN